MNELVSICIPTCDRPDLLREAVESGLVQTYGAVEVIVCDDSRQNHTERMMAERYGSDRRVRYLRNTPPLGQAANVNRLITEAKGRFFALLHDDDRLLPGAVSALHACWDRHPDLTAAYGKQEIIDMKGARDAAGSEILNRDFHRDAAHAGRQQFPLAAAIVGQFPNNAYLILTEDARAVRYDESPAVKNACDFDFGLRLARRPGSAFFFLNEYVAQYRVTEGAISSSRSNTVTLEAYRLLDGLELPVELQDARATVLARLAPAALNWALIQGDTAYARRIFASPSFPEAQKRSLHGAAQAVALALPSPLGGQLLAAVKRAKQSS